MARSIICAVVAACLLMRLVAAQQAGWITDQKNTTMCYWQSPRVGVIRNTLYIDGGDLYWNPGLDDNTYAPPLPDGNPLGLIYLLNFSTPFDTSSNISALMTNISKASGGSGAANNIGPLYVDGTMFANDFEFFTYGGLLADTAAYQNPDAQSVAVYKQYSAVENPAFYPGYALQDLPNKMNRYVTYGAGVSVPSENLGFYFGGLRSMTWGEIVMTTRNETINADVESSTLISIDMSIQSAETWSNDSLPSDVPGRAGAEIAWVPVSDQGVLVAIGGVIDPVYDTLYMANNASEDATNSAKSPGFMKTVSVYDIANQKWYDQPTSGSIPGQLTQGCTVVASSKDSSSHNIYWYGGFDGLNASDSYSDDVWVLSVPGFIWIKLYNGTSAHARAGHRCVKPYPDQMFVVGGSASVPSTGPPACLDGGGAGKEGIVQVFNLSSGGWLDSYDPKIWSNYTVPSPVVDVIGGDGFGNATQVTPSPTGFANSSMTMLFQKHYNQAKITSWYPYLATSEAMPQTTTRTTSSTPSYLAPVLGVVLGLFFITLIILGFLLYRRKYLRSSSGTTSSESGADSRFRITNWLRATPATEKAPPTVTTDERSSSPYEDSSYMAEIDDTQVHEMGDTSRPLELHANDTGLVAIQGRGSFKSSPSNASRINRDSTASRGSHGSPVRPAYSPIQSPVDSPSSEGSPETARVMSGISTVADSDRGHLRGISDTSVSTEGFYATSIEEAIGSPGTSETPVNVGSPRAVSPPTPTAFRSYPS